MSSLVRIALLFLMALASVRSDDAPCDVVLSGENDGYHADMLVTYAYIGTDANRNPYYLSEAGDFLALSSSGLWWLVGPNLNGQSAVWSAAASSTNPSPAFCAT